MLVRASSSLGGQAVDTKLETANLNQIGGLKIVKNILLGKNYPASATDLKAIDKNDSFDFQYAVGKASEFYLVHRKALAFPHQMNYFGTLIDPTDRNPLTMGK
jgi:hypothetical protein